jgi:sigma-B regulation protein RsbU (phosphoserine phosphatase)
MDRDINLRTASLEQLQRLQQVTDTALSHLMVDDLLEELLIRVRDALATDTAAILLLDDQRGELVARAAKGLEEEVQQGTRIPVGRGFAGTIAATGKPVRIFDVDHSIVMNPILRNKGVRSLLGVPLVVEGRAFGVLHVGTLTPRRFNQEDEQFLQLVGDRVALAIHAGLYERERAVARTLQRSFLPERMPVVPGLEMAARYEPSGRREVGGDWYDVFILPNGSVAIAVGDVVGKGITAATTMARLRNALRAYALESYSPGDVLTRLNRLLLHFDPDWMATMMYGIVHPTEMTFTFASAGHIPPVFGFPTKIGVIPALDAGPPLGVVKEFAYLDVQEALLPNATIILCTDGLVERRHESLEVGLRRLAESSSLDEPPEKMVDSIIQRQMSDEGYEDDAAVLVFRTTRTAEGPLVIPPPAQPATSRGGGRTSPDKKNGVPKPSL